MNYHFASCNLDAINHEFKRDGQAIHLEPQVFDVLLVLARNSGKLITRDQLIEEVWNGLIVSDSTISARINAVRSAVGDNGKDQHIIATVPRRGYKMVARVATETPVQAPTAHLGKDARQDIRFTRSLDGVNIAYAKFGKGPPLVRVGHWLTHLEMDWHSPVWQPLLKALGKNNTLYHYDQRGTGLSDRDFIGEDIDDFVGDLKAVVDANGLDEFPLYAASQACPVAIKFAVTYPKRVSKLILYGGFAEGRAFRQSSSADVDEPTILSLIRSGWGIQGSTFVKAFSSLFMPDATPEQIESFVKMQLQSATPKTAVRLRKIVDRFSVQTVLNKVKTPTLVIHARDDVIHPMEQGRLLASKIAGARFIMLDSRNHIQLPQDKSWDLMIREINNFLAL